MVRSFHRALELMALTGLTVPEATACPCMPDDLGTAARAPLVGRRDLPGVVAPVLDFYRPVVNTHHPTGAE